MFRTRCVDMTMSLGAERKAPLSSEQIATNPRSTYPMQVASAVHHCISKSLADYSQLCGLEESQKAGTVRRGKELQKRQSLALLLEENSASRRTVAYITSARIEERASRLDFCTTRWNVGKGSMFDPLYGEGRRCKFDSVDNDHSRV
jgi:hypothetical protein